ncbi:Homocysteine S-methyltransferase [Trametes coccinea BRFM310]|uniref:Homocysteine S-methyltransferase n=1 Tax=Trametes coccinea (strain BRFM310) TaxID=1353009 RepID=A0A1Y2I9K9_TRAC3|nr:Homocysteine S-methyltransferase [Trametes coccinea BRFM310]
MMSQAASKSKVLILDGGLGTTLEDVFHQDISHALWSAKPIEEDPEVIIAAHLAFLRAGANIILTSTYQCAYNTFERAGYSREDAKRIMLKSVALANEARRRYLEEWRQEAKHGDRLSSPPPPPEVKVALSLGPYGGTLSPSHEFDGIYPPPYGPDLSGSQNKSNVFDNTDEGRAQEQASIDALATFHYDRLRIFVDDTETWKTIDYIAFETVPLRREIYAIRQAVARLVEEQESEAAEWQMKPWWISNDYPDGSFPETKTAGDHYTPTEVAEAVLVDEVGATACGIGINCTGTEFMKWLTKEARSAAKSYAQKHGKRPWLVLYPNRGDVYIPETQTWRKMGREGSQWAKDICAVVLENVQSGDWEGVIAGGCCKVGPEEIVGLAKELHAWL